MKILLTLPLLIFSATFSFSQIVANDDYFGPVDGLAGNSNVGNVLANDLLAGGPATLANVTLLVNGASPISIDPNGMVSVSPGTPSGTYAISYIICENAPPQDCDDALVTITVTNSALSLNANDDIFGPINSQIGNPGSFGGNVLANDFYGITPLATTFVTISVSNPATPLTPADPVPTLDIATGDITVPFMTPFGVYTLSYIVCELINPVNCDLATVTIIVGTIPVVDDGELFSISNLTLPNTAGNVLSNSTINGVPTAITNVTITVDSPASPINIGDPVPELDILTGDIYVPAATPVGNYFIDYTLTDLNLTSVSSTATISVFEPMTGISGTVFLDGNSNCLIDATDTFIPNQLVRCYDLGNNLIAQTYSNINGDYNFNLPAGQYSVNLASLQAGTSVTCPLSGSVAVTVVSGTISSNNDFGLECNQSGLDVNVFGIYRWNWVFPGQIHSLAVASLLSNNFLASICNLNGPASGTLTIAVSGPIIYSGIPAGALTPSSITGTTFSYTVADYSTIDFNSFIVNLQTLTTAQIGDMVTVTATYTPTSTDGDLTNNTLTYTYPVVNSYDPNMKEVSPPGDVLVGFNDELIYTIYFQNLGNAPAFNIKLTDTLSSNLDLETFERMGSSHTCDVTILDNELTVLFPNIMLPDSASNPEGSIGFFQYKIKPLPNLAIGTSIENTAHIFFDFNPAVVTNTVVTNYIDDNGIDALSMKDMKIYPNPSKGDFVVQLDESITGTVKCEIIDVTGKKVNAIVKVISNGILEWNGKLESGIYFIRITDIAKGQDYIGRISVE